MHDYWYKDAVIYGVDVGSFQDSNGDGIGDFPGLTSRLDYLADLGVTCLWVLPFCPTADRDNGYDTTNYLGVDPSAGTLDDFITFVRRAGEHGIRVLLDLVMNHTSDQHPWFRAARQDPKSRYRDYYVWAETPPPVPPDKGNIFGEETVWTYDEVAGAYYYHRFYHFEPGLKVSNPEVQAELKRVLDFWLSFPIGGFRVDAASHMVEQKGQKTAEPSDPHGILKDMRRHVETRREGAVLLGEADVEPSRLADFFGDGDELNLLFNFLLDNYLFLALARQEAEPIQRVLRLLPATPPAGQWVNFLRNLDEADLERLTDEERQDVFRTFAPEPDMQIYGRGMRRRLAPMLRDRRQLEMAWSLLFSLPGTPLFVYGDEIGMGEDLSLPGRNSVRTPMQWSAEKNAGFSTAPARALKRPVIAKGDFSYKQVNVAAQRDERDSLWHAMKRIIATRRQCPEIGRGTSDVVATDQPAVMAHLCKYQREALVAVHNLADRPVTATLEVDPAGGSLDRRLGNAEPDSDREHFRVRLPAFGYGWFRVKGA